MTQPSALTRTLQEFADRLRGLQVDHPTMEERATMRAVLIELNWLMEQPKPEEGT